MADCCSGSNVLFYACSGGSNVAEAADLAARKLAAEGLGKMFCLAGLGAGIHSMIKTAAEADFNIVIDGCPTKCAQKIFEKCGLRNTEVVCVSDLGIKKSSGVKATADEVNCVVAAVKEILQKKWSEGVQ